MAFNNGEGFYIQYILKPQPRTRGFYSLKMIPSSNDVRICSLVLTHVGENFPCVEVNPSISYANARIRYASGAVEDARKCGTEAEFMFEVSGESILT